MSDAQEAFIMSSGDQHVPPLRICWWLVPDNRTGCTFKFSGEKQEEEISLLPYQTGILGFNGKCLEVLSGSVAVLTADFISLVKLQAFIDEALNIPEINHSQKWLGFSAFRFKGELNRQLFERWLITQNIRKCAGSDNIVSILRSTEWYWIVRYLLKADGGELSLKSLGENYGLSVSHFRRLSKAALGNTTKEEMCNWRLTRALLDLMETEESITSVALRHGYASLSHFSNEVKTVLGVPPRDLKNILTSDIK